VKVVHQLTVILLPVAVRLQVSATRSYSLTCYIQFPYERHYKCLLLTLSLKVALTLHRHHTCLCTAADAAAAAVPRKSKKKRRTVSDDSTISMQSLNISSAPVTDTDAEGECCVPTILYIVIYTA
jgi:hypothetical protein